MKLYVLVTIVFGLSFVAKSQNLDDKFYQTMENYLSEFPERTQFSIAAIDGNVTKFYGLIKTSDSAATRIENETSQFQIGSVTKVFTSVLLAKLVAEKKLKLADTIQKFFNFPLKENSITLEKLSNHTSGLPRLPSNLDLNHVNPRNPYVSYSEDDMKFYLAEELETSNGKEAAYQYSNLGAAILAKALENSTNKTYEALLLKKIFQPLQMTQSTSDETKALNLVQGYNENGTQAELWDLAEFKGAGAIVSTTNDLSKFVKAYFQDKDEALSLSLLPTFTVNPNLRIALGWHILQDSEGNDLYWHNGGTGGYTSSVYMVPETKKAIIILTNVSAFHSKASKIDELGYRLLGSK